jgi:uncharacterized membrane protein YeaQ/YmgE (transglycosylase-associated protein family)
VRLPTSQDHGGHAGLAPPGGVALPPCGLHTFFERMPWASGVLDDMIGALFLSLFCGIVARMLIPGDAFRQMSGPLSWLTSLVLGLVGAFVGYLIFTVGLGIGDTDVFDWGGVLSALIGTVLVLLIASLVMRHTSNRPG